MKAGGSELCWDVVARAAATQIANIRQIFLNSSVATQLFDHYLALLLALPADQEISNLITVTEKHQSSPAEIPELEMRWLGSSSKRPTRGGRQGNSGANQHH